MILAIVLSLYCEAGEGLEESKLFESDTSLCLDPFDLLPKA